jgi:hypothetical protein
VSPKGRDVQPRRRTELDDGSAQSFGRFGHEEYLPPAEERGVGPDLAEGLPGETGMVVALSPRGRDRIPDPNRARVRAGYGDTESAYLTRLKWPGLDSGPELATGPESPHVTEIEQLLGGIRTEDERVSRHTGDLHVDQETAGFRGVLRDLIGDLGCRAAGE